MRATSLTAACIRAAFLLLLAALAGWIASHFLGATLETMQRAAQTESWPATSGSIDASGMVAPKGGGRSRAQVHYTYVVAGRRYAGNTVQFGNPSSAGAFVHDFPVGEHEVFYSPTDPSQAVLRRGLASGTSFVLALQCAFAFVPLLLVWKAGAEVWRAWRVQGRGRGRKARAGR